MNAATSAATAVGHTAFWDAFPPALLAAAITAVVAVLLHLLKTRSEEGSRARVLYAEAYEWYAAYKELPYAVRRRRVDEPAAERIRLSETSREIQAKLDHFKTWTALQNTEVGTAYAVLLLELRQVAGTSIHAAWNEPGTDTDSGMNMAPGRVDLGAWPRTRPPTLPLSGTPFFRSRAGGAATPTAPCPRLRTRGLCDPARLTSDEASARRTTSLRRHSRAISRRLRMRAGVSALGESAPAAWCPSGEELAQRPWERHLPTVCR